MGRINKYASCVQPELSNIEQWIKEGKTEAEVCDLLGISISAFNSYKKSQPELQEVIYKSKRNNYSRAKKTLLEKALGYYVELPETFYERKKQPDGTFKEVVTKRVVRTKYIEPDMKAILYVLINNGSLEITGEEFLTIPLDEKELRRELLELKKKIVDNQTW